MSAPFFGCARCNLGYYDCECDGPHLTWPPNDAPDPSVTCRNCGRHKDAHTREKIIGLDAYRYLCDFYRGDPRKHGVRYFTPASLTPPPPTR